MQTFEKYVDPQNNDIFITAGAGLFMGANNEFGV
jgi:hypothetical protein